MRANTPVSPCAAPRPKSNDSSASAPAFAMPGIRKAVKITAEEITLISKYIYDISGIHIEPTKAYLLETRLGKMLEAQGCSSYLEFYHKIKGDHSKELEKSIIDAITTNETLFFRDASPFDLLKYKILPEIIDRRSSKTPRNLPIPIRIWSSACSTGQEVYSIAIILKELLADLSRYKINLLGTDLSDAAIKQASYGIYNKFEIERGLPHERLQRYFLPSGQNWKIKDEIRSLATFRKMNLINPFNGLCKFDIIFCRNVAIYFTLQDRMKLFDKIANVLELDGFLIIGSTESLTGVCPRFIPHRHLKSIFYQLRQE